MCFLLEIVEENSFDIEFDLENPVLVKNERRKIDIFINDNSLKTKLFENDSSSKNKTLQEVSDCLNLILNKVALKITQINKKKSKKKRVRTSESIFLSFRKSIKNKSNLIEYSKILKPRNLNAMAFVFTNVFNWKLLHRFENDAHSKSLFKKFCTGETPTVVLIESAGSIAGGFTPSPWTGGSNNHYSREAFLFSFRQNKKYLLKKNEFYVSTSEYPGTLVCFGKDDLCVFENFNSDLNYSKLGRKYGEDENSHKNGELLGNGRFRIQTVEVFQVY